MSTTQAESAISPGLAMKILKASQSIGAVKKSRSGGVNYAFQTWEDLQPVIKSACIDQGLLLLPSMKLLSKDIRDRINDQGRAFGISVDWVVEVTLTLVDAETGASYTCHTSGEATDTSDKGLQKAFTSALKYLLLKIFQVLSSSDQTDSDKSQPTRDGTVKPDQPSPVKKAPFAKPAHQKADPLPQAQEAAQPQAASQDQGVQTVRTYEQSEEERKKPKTPDQEFCSFILNQMKEAFPTNGKNAFNHFISGMNSTEAATALRALWDESDRRKCLENIYDLWTRHQLETE